MNKIEQNQTICRIFKLFYNLGIWQNEQESRKEFAVCKIGRKLFYLIYFVQYQIFLVTYALLSDNSNASAFLTAIEIPTAVITIKLVYLLWKKEEILTFIYDPIVSHSSADGQDLEEIKKKVKIFTKFIQTYMVMLVSGTVVMFFSCLPIFSSGKMLPLFISFKLSSKYSEILYWLAYGYVTSFLLCVNLVNFSTVIFWYIMLNYSIEYQVLGNKLKNLGINKTEQLQENCQSASRNLFHQDLIGLIRAQRNIFWYRFVQSYVG